MRAKCTHLLAALTPSARNAALCAAIADSGAPPRFRREQVEAGNEPAELLYRALGYQVAAEDRFAEKPEVRTRTSSNSALWRGAPLPCAHTPPPSDRFLFLRGQPGVFGVRWVPTLNVCLRKDLVEPSVQNALSAVPILRGL